MTTYAHRHKYLKFTIPPYNTIPKVPDDQSTNYGSEEKRATSILKHN